MNSRYYVFYKSGILLLMVISARSKPVSKKSRASASVASAANGGFICYKGICKHKSPFPNVHSFTPTGLEIDFDELQTLPELGKTGDGSDEDINEDRELGSSEDGESGSIEDGESGSSEDGDPGSSEDGGSNEDEIIEDGTPEDIKRYIRVRVH